MSAKRLESILNIWQLFLQVSRVSEKELKQHTVRGKYSCWRCVFFFFFGGGHIAVQLNISNYKYLNNYTAYYMQRLVQM